jgi:DNA-binding transcriptional regulator GbsR (MarR family)
MTAPGISHAPSVSSMLETLMAMSDADLQNVNLTIICKKAGISRRSASRALAELEKTEVVKTVWSRTGGRGGRYTIIVDRSSGELLAEALSV